MSTGAQLNAALGQRKEAVTWCVRMVLCPGELQLQPEVTQDSRTCPSSFVLAILSHLNSSKETSGGGKGWPMALQV